MSKQSGIFLNPQLLNLKNRLKILVFLKKFIADKMLERMVIRNQNVPKLRGAAAWSWT